MFCTDRRGRRSLQVCVILDILIVGATSGRPPFIKISLRFARAAEDVVPYSFGGFLNSMLVGEGFPLPPNRRKTIGRRNASPTDIIYRFDFREKYSPT